MYMWQYIYILCSIRWQFLIHFILYHSSLHKTSAVVFYSKCNWRFAPITIRQLIFSNFNFKTDIQFWNFLYSTMPNIGIALFSQYFATAMLLTSVYSICWHICQSVNHVHPSFSAIKYTKYVCRKSSIHHMAIKKVPLLIW